MKLHISRSLLIACCFLTATVLFAAPPAPAADNGSTVSVGEFVIRLADAVNPAHHEIKTLEQAKTYFAGQGVSIPADLDLSAPLKQSDVSVITSLLGFNVNATEPDKTFDSESVDGFIGFVRGEVEEGHAPSPTAPTAGRSGPPLTISGMGACCCPGLNGTCSQDQPTPCHNNGCVYRGKGIPCSPDPCPSDKGVCCVSGDCTFTTAGDCPGVFRGLSSCNPGTCHGNKVKPAVSGSEP